MEEDWKSIPGYKDYAVSNQGRVMRVTKGRGPTQQGKILRVRKTSDGYLAIGLFHEGKRHHRQIHQLVAHAFWGPCPIGKEINHKNGIKGDNKIGNLEYVSHSENVKHGFRIGLRTHTGERHPKAKLNWAKVSKIFTLYKTGLSQQKIADILDVSRGTISDVLTGRTWKTI